jgi:hypothetical protein
MPTLKISYSPFGFLFQGQLSPAFPRDVQRLDLRAAWQARLTGLGPLDRHFNKSLWVTAEMQISATKVRAIAASTNHFAPWRGKRDG